MAAMVAMEASASGDTAVIPASEPRIATAPSPTADVTADLTSKPYDCTAGPSNLKKLWPAAKLHWCSQHRHDGSETSVERSPSPSAECNTQCLFDTKTATCKFRIQWATDHRFIGQLGSCELAHKFVLGYCPPCANCTLAGAICKPSPTTTLMTTKAAPVVSTSKPPPTTVRSSATTAPSKLFDCDAGYLNWANGWSSRKKTWCCAHARKGCVVSTSSLPFDCWDGYAHWELGWSDDKKRWCCGKEGLGCPSSKPKGGPTTPGPAAPPRRTTSTSSTTSTSTTLTPPAPTTSPWATSTGQVSPAPPASPASPLSPASPAPSRPSPSTSSSPSTSPAAPYACHVGLTNWQHGWSVEKIQWCCREEGLGCAAAPGPAPPYAPPPLPQGRDRSLTPSHGEMTQEWKPTAQASMREFDVRQKFQRGESQESFWRFQAFSVLFVIVFIGCLGVIAMTVLARRWTSFSYSRRLKAHHSYTELQLPESAEVTLLE